jgi:hypothetical protein
MRENNHKTDLGELVVAVFDIAAQYSTDPREVSRLATRVVMQIVRRACKARVARPSPTALATQTGASAAS